MINTDRIVPVTATDLITLYGLILLQASANSGLAKLEADGIGEFQVKSGSAPLLAAESAKKIDIDATESSVSAATIYFVPAFDYKGFSIDGADITPTGDVVADGRTLYKATLASGAVTIVKAGF